MRLDRATGCQKTRIELMFERRIRSAVLSIGLNEGHLGTSIF